MGHLSEVPGWIIATIGIIQMILTLAIIALEIYADYLDLAHGTIWVGIWAGIIFIITFYKTIVASCSRGVCNIIYVLILNLISICLGIVVIYFDSVHMNNLCKCYLGDQLCCLARGISTLQRNFSGVLVQCGTSPISCPSIPDGKAVYIKAQLAAAICMMIACAVFILLFILSCAGCCSKKKKK